jgi:Ca2+-binding RTX toxin-like protein
VQSAITYALGTDVENLTLTGAAAINGTGTSLNNILTGNSAANSLTGLEGHDTLDGGVGADILLGGLGNDTYVVEDADDVVTENLNEGTDLVQSTVSYALTANVENLTLTGASAINGIGNALNNRLTGNSAANVLTGGAGHDTYVVSTGDTVVEHANEGTDTVQSDVSWTLGADLEHLTLTGTAAIDATGNTVNNRLTGNNAANQLAGGVGHDTLRGGLGDDTYLINRGEGQDVITENDGIVGNNDRLQYGATINPLDLVVSRQVNDLRLAVHGSADQVTIKDWYAGTTHHIETLQAGNGALLYSTQVDQLIQAMASFSQQSGLTWDQAIDQRPQEVQAILAASWQ